MVGSAIVRALKAKGIEPLVVNKQEVDLKDQAQVMEWFKNNRPDKVFLAAAKVGGIHANDVYSADFIYDNLMIQNNVIHAAHIFGVNKLCFLGSVCIYPKYADEPVQESSLLSGPLEPTNQWYAVAKIAGIKLCQAYHKQYGHNYISVMPCNLYGVNDNFHPTNSHVIPALIRRYHESKVANKESVLNWGTGMARREFLYVDDMADACLFLMDNYDSPEIINIGCGEDHTIREITQMIQDIVGYSGKTLWNIDKPDGTPKRLLDSSKLFGLGWRPKVKIQDGLALSYEWFVANKV